MEIMKQEIQDEHKKLENLLYEMMCILRNVLLDYEKAYLMNLISHNEGGIAFEDMIAAIKFHKIPLTKSDFETIKSVGELMGLSKECWEGLFSE